MIIIYFVKEKIMLLSSGHEHSAKHDLPVPSLWPRMDQADGFAPGAVSELQAAEVGCGSRKTEGRKAEEKSSVMTRDELEWKRSRSSRPIESAFRADEGSLA